MAVEIPVGVAARIRSQVGLGSTSVDTVRFPRTPDGWESADTGLYRKTKVRVSTMTEELVVWTYVLDAFEGADLGLYRKLHLRVHTLGGERTNITFYTDVRVPDSALLTEGQAVLRLYRRSVAKSFSSGLEEALARWIPDLVPEFAGDVHGLSRLLRSQLDLSLVRLLRQTFA